MKPFSLANEIIVKQKVEYSVVNKQGDSRNAIHFRSNLEPVTQQISRRDC